MMWGFQNNYNIIRKPAKLAKEFLSSSKPSNRQCKSNERPNIGKSTAKTMYNLQLHMPNTSHHTSFIRIYICNVPQQQPIV